MSINLALADAANNCIREHATAVLTLRGSGVQLSGKLERTSAADLGTVHMKTEAGWITVVVDEIVAVESWKR